MEVCKPESQAGRAGRTGPGLDRRARCGRPGAGLSGQSAMCGCRSWAAQPAGLSAQAGQERPAPGSSRRQDRIGGRGRPLPAAAAGRPAGEPRRAGCRDRRSARHSARRHQPGGDLHHDVAGVVRAESLVLEIGRLRRPVERHERTPGPRQRPGRGPASVARFASGPSGTSSRTGEWHRDRLTYHTFIVILIQQAIKITGLDQCVWDPSRRNAITPRAEPDDDLSPRATSPGNRLRTLRTKRDRPVQPSDQAVSWSDTLLAAEPYGDDPENPREALTRSP
jgi:hypothetical protein